MTSRKTVLVGVLAGVVFAHPVLAASQEGCLRHNRILSLKTLDERTVLVTDRAKNRYAVRMNPGCLGLTDGSATLVFRPATDLGCIGPGDLLGVRTAAHGFISCSIVDVQAAQ